MNSEILEGKWEKAKGQIRKKWGKLTEDDITTMKGKSQKLYGNLQEKYG